MFVGLFYFTVLLTSLLIFNYIGTFSNRDILSSVYSLCYRFVLCLLSSASAA